MTPHREILLAHDYAMVDRYTLKRSRVPWHIQLPLIPLVPDMLRDRVQLTPYLVPLKSIDPPYFNNLCASLEIAESRDDPGNPIALSCLLTVDSGVSQSTLVQHLIERLVMNSPQGYFMFRYFDSPVFLHLERILWTEQLCALYGPVKTWTCSFNKSWISFPRPVPQGVVPLLPYVKAAQREQIDNLGYINSAIANWRYHLDKKPWRDLEEFKRASEQAERAVVLAQREFALESKDEIVAFTEHSLTYGEHFYRHPRIQHLFELRKQYAYWTYHIAAYAVTREEWAAIAAASQ